jgi:hypothetical protein
MEHGFDGVVSKEGVGKVCGLFLQKVLQKFVLLR